MTFTTKGLRSDSADLFRLCGSFASSTGKLKHTQFIVLNGSSVEVVDNRAEMEQFPPETQVLVQWRGEWRSDIFIFTVGAWLDYKKQAGL